MSFDKPRCFCPAAMVWLFAAALSLAAGIAVAENGQTPSAGAPDSAPGAATSSAAPAAPAAGKPGFLHELREWWDYSISGFSAKMQDARSKVETLNQKSTDAVKGAASATQDAMKSTAEATKGAASTLMRLPSTRVIEIRERCPPAPNGAPDCQTAAAGACRGKGFSTGQPLDVVSAEKCPVASALSAQKPGDQDCPVETVVSRAVCQ
jgi:hypothetical protein